MPVISVGGRGSFDSAPGDTILESGLRAGFGFPRACRNGNCERCAGQLLAGCVTLIKSGRRLCAGEAGSEAVLYCIARATTDCEIAGTGITAPGELPLLTLRCQISDIHPLNHNVSAVTLRLPAGQRVEWHAGQYLLLGEQQDAAFSIANASRPGGRDVHLHIRHDDDNASAVELLAQLRRDGMVSATLPLGERYIDQPPQQPVWFICGSTGFAPARAMIERLAQLDFHQPVRLFRGGRSQADLYPPCWDDQTLSRLTDFITVEAVNEQPASGQFQGHVHQAALAMLENPTVPLFHVGGSPAMAWAVFDALITAGVPAAHIHSDVYDYAPRS
jgi:CDP-4-dehydro-6-deoxyglucose reductase, E3